MDILVNIIIGIITLVLGFLLDRLWEWHKKKKAGLTGQAHSIIMKLGSSVISYEGNYFLSNSPNDNYRIAKHVYEHSAGEVISTCFRENPINYGEHDLARLLPNASKFARLTIDSICSEQDISSSMKVLNEIKPDSEIIQIPSDLFITSIDGIFVELTDKTNIAFVTFPKTGEQHHNRGIIFYGHTAKAFFDYYKDLKNSVKNK